MLVPRFKPLRKSGIWQCRVSKNILLRWGNLDWWKFRLWTCFLRHFERSGNWTTTAVWVAFCRRPFLIIHQVDSFVHFPTFCCCLLSRQTIHVSVMPEFTDSFAQKTGSKKETNTLLASRKTQNLLSSSPNIVRFFFLWYFSKFDISQLLALPTLLFFLSTFPQMLKWHFEPNFYHLCSISTIRGFDYRFQKKTMDNR